MTTILVRNGGLGLEALARQTGVHPDLLRRFVSLGIIDVAQTPEGALRFQQRAVARVSRAQRLRLGLGLNYASLGLVLDLLDRIAVLEASQAPRHRPQTRSDLP